MSKNDEDGIPESKEKIDILNELENDTSKESINFDEILNRQESLNYQFYPGTEREYYDFNAERVNPRATNLVESTSHLIKSCLGAGVLSIHEGFMYAGLWTALVMTFFMGIVVSYTMMMLVKSAQKMYIRLRISKLSYPDLVEVVVSTSPWIFFRRYSKCFRYTVDICLFVEMFGTCCIYEIMIAYTLKQIVEGMSLKIQNIGIRMYLLVVMIPLMFLCMIRSLKYLAPFSLIADIFVGICVITTIYYSMVTSSSIYDRPAWKDIHGFFRFCGVCLYSIDGVGVTLPVENNMRKPKYFGIVLQYGMTIVIISLATIGFFGYWGWGENCRSPITIHMPLDLFPTILQVLLVIMLCVTFAVHFWVPFRVVWHYISKWHKRKRSTWERFYRVVHVTLITGIAVAFPQMIRMMVFIGNFFLAYLAFVFPPFIECLVTWREPRKRHIRMWLVAKNLALMLFGVFLSGGAFYSLID